MERGPIALFGAIVAVGLGPAMWLGAQFGNFAATPGSPPAVSSEHKPQHKQDLGGTAGSAPEDPAAVLDTDPRADIKPLSNTTHQARPAASHTGIPTGKPTVEPTPSTATPTPSDTSDDPPTDSTTPADPPPGDGGGGGAVPPAPPTTSGGGGGNGAGSGSGAGSGGGGGGTSAAG